ncbi:hypothetical protein JRO89_XS05G0208600 [Xanthoceras sorbifolium]|uniref:Uncharacterized protein n=1 Tax=Xanthoceras sorbifolium TaxID=99658 RepID=A0ABQ8I2L9_9ROSI|nr:hypothetical protein JRO89_XS05G0208600 [Xanthoceras sorbifolium]
MLCLRYHPTIDRADVLRENTEGVFAACDAAHGRWAKLLGIGGRLGYSIRGTLQSQAKALLISSMNLELMTKIKAAIFPLLTDSATSESEETENPVGAQENTTTTQAEGDNNLVDEGETTDDGSWLDMFNSIPLPSDFPSYDVADFWSRYSIRGTLQSQARAFVDFQHESRMTKIKAVLDQETWVQVDVPDEFQAIVMSLFSSEALVSGSTDDIQGNMTTYSEVVTSNDSTIIAPSGPQNSHHQIERTDSSEVISSNPAQVNSPSAEANEKNKVDATSSSVQTNSSNMEECRKSTSQTLSYGGVVTW